MKTVSRFFLMLLVVVLFLCIRFFESALFYDPFLSYFKTNYIQLPFPNVDKLKWLTNSAFRYSINTALSVALIQLLFNKAEVTKIAAMLFLIIFIVLLPVSYAAFTLFPDQKMLFFYLRRLLIQPVFVLIFIPAFYFQLKMSKRNKTT